MHVYKYSSLAVALMYVSPALAQTGSVDSSGDQTAEAARGGIEEIVVTAQRRSESAQDVPISITAVSATRFIESGVDDIRDIATVAPAVSVFTAAGYTNPRVRGIGTTAVGPGIENPVGMYVDSVYYAVALTSGFPLNNIAQVEVLKGPQGTLFGRNATGGVINIITKDPRYEPGLNFSVGYGNYETVAADAYVTGGLTDTLAADLSVHYTTQGKGYGRNEPFGDDSNRLFHDLGLRSKWLLELSPSTTVKLSLDYAESEGTFPDYKQFPGEKTLFGPISGGRAWDTTVNTHTLSVTKGGGAALQIEQDVGKLKLVSISAYRRSKLTSIFDFDQSPVAAATLSYVQNDWQFSQEVQLQSDPANPVKWTAGIYYFEARGSFDPFQLAFQGPLLDPTSPTFPIGRTVTAGYVRTSSIAPFVQATVPLGESTNLTGGLRYTHDSRRMDADTTGYLFDGTSLGSIIAPGSGQQKVDFGKLTWRASLDHSFGDVLGYVSYNRGFKAGGFNVSTPDEPAFDPEVLDAYEVGFKADLFDRHVRLNPSVFYYDYKNIQVAIALPSGALGIQNGPSAKVYGFDLDGEIMVTDALRLTGGLTLLHHRFGDFPAASANIPNPAGGNIPTTVQAKGNRFPFTSDIASTLGATYTIDTGKGSIVLAGNWTHSGGYYVDVANWRRQQSYHLFNASVQWNIIRDTVYARVWGENLSNRPVISQANGGTFGSGTAYNRPRTYGLTLGASF